MVDKHPESWAVSVEEIRSLAAQLIRAQNDDPVYQAGVRGATNSDIEAWVADVGAVVDVRLRRRSRLHPNNRARVETAAIAVIKTGAAAYLVDAAAPTRAGVNDNASYGNVLWTRYQTRLDELVDMVDEWVADGGGEDDAPGAHQTAGAGTFQCPIFPDTQQF